MCREMRQFCWCHQQHLNRKQIRGHQRHTVFLYIKLQVSVQWITRDSNTSPEPDLSAHATDTNITYKRKTDLKDSYFCVTGSFCQTWLKHPWLCCDIPTETSSRAQRNHPHPTGAKTATINKEKTWKPHLIEVETSSWVFTLTPATKTPSADFTTFLKKSSSFSFLFFPRTLSFWQQDMKKKRKMNNTELAGIEHLRFLSTCLLFLGAPRGPVLTDDWLFELLRNPKNEMNPVWYLHPGYTPGRHGNWGLSWAQDEPPHDIRRPHAWLRFS